MKIFQPGGGGGGGGGGSFEVPTGTVDGVNKTFVFTTAPVAIAVDGGILEKVSSDTTVNWTGTTTVTMTVAPTFDIFGVGSITATDTKSVLALSANAAEPAINTDLYDVVHITAQTAAITSFTTNLTGTPADGDTLRISVTGTGSVALTFGASFEASTVPLSTTTSGTTRLDMGFFWNTETSKWRQVAVA